MVTYSIVIPVYNAEEFLGNCIDSVLAQRTFSPYEIILVNDGSRDRSPQICDWYAEKNACIKVIHQANQGVSTARNAGIAAASGDYVLFLDSDDLWADDLLQSLDDIILQKPDVIEFGYRIFCGENVQPPVLPIVETSAITGSAYLNAHIEHDSMPIASCCVAAFRRQFLQEHDLRFPLGVTYGEDFDLHMRCLKAADSVFAIRKSFYWYRMNEASVTHTITVKRMQDMLASGVKAFHLFPCSLFANYYCGLILGLDALSRADALQLKEFLRENRDILRHVSGVKMRFACMLYKVFGWYHASRLVQFCLNIRHGKKA